MNVTVPAASLRRKRAAERHRRNVTEHQSSQKRQALTLSRVSADRPAAAARNQPFHHHLAEDDPEASCSEEKCTSESVRRKAGGLNDLPRFMI